jgi:hypothetical protein
MTRAASGDTVTVAPSNNVYTGLLGLAVVVVAIGLVVLFLRANTLGVKFF